MKRFILWILSLFGLALGAALAGFFALGALVPEIPQTAAFPVIETHVIYNVDDAGTADLDGNGSVDRWTTNHSAAQWIMLNGAPVAPGDIGLSQDPRLPGLEAGSGLIPDGPVRLYMDDSRFVLDAQGSASPVTGSFTIPWKTEARAAGGASAIVHPCDTGPKCHEVRFTLPDGGRVEIEPVPAPSDGFTIAITFAPDTDLSQIRIGHRALIPDSHSLLYASRDRHGLALADLDGDGAPEIFQSRGGARGELFQIEPNALDEFFDWADGTFTDRISETGITKEGCPGRQTAWVDVNADGIQDLYQVCGRAAGASQGFANRLYKGNADGTYTEAAAEFGLDFTSLGSFRFFRDTAPGAPLSLLWVAPDRVALYVQDAEGVFTEAWSNPRGGGNLDKIVIADLDGDGAWEALIANRQASHLFRPEPGGAPKLDLAELGLPTAFEDAQILDANADGRPDIFTLPQGLFLGQEDGRFAKSDALDVTWASEGVRFAWFDADEDGDLDLWLLKRDGAQFPRPVLSLYNRLPRTAQSLLENRYGKGALRGRYWRAVLYENRLDQGGTVFVERPTDDNGQTLPPGTPIAVTLEGPEGPVERWHLVGETDSTRLSMTRPDIAVSVPNGSQITQIRANLP